MRKARARGVHAAGVRGIGRRTAAAVLTVACAIAASGFVVFHTHLKRSAPANGQRLTAPPAAIELWFSEKPELAVTSITLQSTSGTVVPLAPLTMSDASDTAAVVAKPKATIAPGAYEIHWRTMARDGHPARGTLSFTLAPSR